MGWVLCISTVNMSAANYLMLRRVVIHRSPLNGDTPIGKHVNHLSVIRARDALSLNVTRNSLQYLKIAKPCTLMDIKLLIPASENLHELHISLSVDGQDLDHHPEYPIDTAFKLQRLHTLYVTHVPHCHRA